ncbi:cyclodeaminase/cyclohydrolase family protein [Clostridium sediminicola]|uniref:cyclodeaminase/cyclohydrolase family protein n=1 Tax=Clostridium sediminicola TaxID=3114879 RepID=UPI0031F23F73
MFNNCTIKEFLDELASKSPAPGGGSTAALAASLGSSLSSMVFNLTIGKKMFDEYSDEIQESIHDALKKAEESKEEFLKLMDKDTEAFMGLMDAFKLPKESEEEKVIRSAKIQKGLIDALEVPLEMAEKAFELYDVIKIACKYGNKNAISDAGVAALMIQSGIESAVLNTRINVASIKDKEYKGKTEERCNVLVNEGRIFRDNVLEVVYDEIGGIQ